MGFLESGAIDYSRYQEYGIFIEKGISNAAGSKELYLNIMEMFLHDEERRAQLRQFIADGNSHDYGIQVHALKGESRTLGADCLADMAYEHEKQSKAGNLAYVEEHWDELVECWEKTLEGLNEFCRENGRGQAKASAAALPVTDSDRTVLLKPEEIQEVVSLISEYETFKAIAKMRKWLQRPLDSEQQVMIERVLVAIEREYDDDKAIEILRNY